MSTAARRPMFLFYFSISLAIASSALYHFTQKKIHADAHPAVSTIVTYLVSLGLCLVLLAAMPPEGGFISALRKLNWASYALAISLLGLEVGFLLVYRSGWNIGLAAVLVNVAASLILVPVGLLVFHDKLSAVNIAGIVVCLLGLVMLNWSR